MSFRQRKLKGSTSLQQLTDIVGRYRSPDVPAMERQNSNLLFEVRELNDQIAVLKDCLQEMHNSRAEMEKRLVESESVEYVQSLKQQIQDSKEEIKLLQSQVVDLNDKNRTMSQLLVMTHPEFLGEGHEKVKRRFMSAKEKELLSELETVKTNSERQEKRTSQLVKDLKKQLYKEKSMREKLQQQLEKSNQTEGDEDVAEGEGSIQSNSLNSPLVDSNSKLRMEPSQATLIESMSQISLQESKFQEQEKYVQFLLKELQSSREKVVELQQENSMLQKDRLGKTMVLQEMVKMDPVEVKKSLEKHPLLRLRKHFPSHSASLANEVNQKLMLLLEETLQKNIDYQNQLKKFRGESKS